MKKNRSSTFRKGKILFANKFSLSDGLIYKTKFKVSNSNKDIKYSQKPDFSNAQYWSNATTSGIENAAPSEPYMVLIVNETINIELASIKELESITLYTSSGIPLFAIENMGDEKITLPKPIPGQYFVEAQFKTSRIIQSLEVTS